MDRSEIIRSNARAILPHVRGKSVRQRRKIYAALMMGPVGIGLLAVEALWINSEKIFDGSFSADARPKWVSAPVSTS